MQLPEISHSSVGSTKRLQPLAIWPLTTTPLADVIVLLVALPVFWLVGVEQFLPMLLLGWAAIKLLLTRRTLRLTPLGILFFLFLLLQIVSATSIDLRTNWIVFAKNFASYLAGFLIFLIIVNQVKSVRQYRLLVGCMVILISLITLIGVLFIVGLLPGKFEALGARFIPGFLRGSEFVQQNIILREVGRPQARLGSVTYPRVSSVFLFPTTAAVGYLIFLPFLAYVRQQAVGLKRGLITLLWLSSGVNFLFTATRTAVIGLIISTIIVYLWQKRRYFPKLLLPALASLLMLFVLTFLFLNLNTILETGQSFFVNTRADSFTGRTAVYVATFDSLTIHPFIGWGTPRAIPTVKLAPAGTHGEYINILYSFGLIGLTLYLGLYLLIWLKIIKQMTQRQPPPLVLSIATTILALNINGVAHGINFDLLTVLFFWVIVALLYIPTDTQTLWNNPK